MEIEKEETKLSLVAPSKNSGEFRASLSSSDGSFVALSFTDDFDPLDVKNEVDVVHSDDGSCLANIMGNEFSSLTNTNKTVPCEGTRFGSLNYGRFAVSDDSLSMETQRCSNLVGVFTTGSQMDRVDSTSTSPLQELEKKIITSADSIREFHWQGEVRVLVHEVNNLWDISDGKEKSKNPYVMLSLMEGQLKKKIRSDSYRTSNNNPKFYEECVVSVVVPKSVVVLKLMNKKLPPLQDEVLGEVNLDLKKMYLGGETKEQWFPLRNSELADAKVLISVSFFPCNIAGPLEARRNFFFPRTRVVLSNKRNFFGGEKVQGIIINSVGKPYNLQNIKIYFEGVQSTYWRDKTLSYVSNLAQEPNAEKRKFLRVEATVVEATEKIGYRLESGRYVYPFEFLIPDYIIPSVKLHMTNCHTYYQFHIEIKRARKDRQSDLSMLYVHTDWSRINEAQFVDTFTNNLSIFKGDVTMTVKMNKKYYFKDDALSIEVDIKNGCKKSITGIAVNCQEERVVKAHQSKRHWPFTWFQSDQIAIEPHFPIKRDKSAVFTVNLGKPFTRFKDPSIEMSPQFSPLMKVEYSLNLFVNIDGKKKAILRIPIIFGERLEDMPDYLTGPKEDQGKFFFKHVQELSNPVDPNATVVIDAPDTPEDPSILAAIQRRVRSGSGSLRSGSIAAPRKLSLEKDTRPGLNTSATNLTNQSTAMPISSGLPIIHTNSGPNSPMSNSPPNSYAYSPSNHSPTHLNLGSNNHSPNQPSPQSPPLFVNGSPLNTDPGRPITPRARVFDTRNLIHQLGQLNSLESTSNSLNVTYVDDDAIAANSAKVHQEATASPALRNSSSESDDDSKAIGSKVKFAMDRNQSSSEEADPDVTAVGHKDKQLHVHVHDKYTVV